MKVVHNLTNGKLTALALLMTLSLIACSDDNNENNKQTTNNTNNTTADMNNVQPDMTATTDMPNDTDMGDDMETPPPAFAKLQVIHASADPAAASVDVYVNNVKLLDDLDFREGTNFFTVAAEASLKIDITAADAADNSAPAYTVTLPGLAKDETYVAVAAGLLDTNAPAAQQFKLLAIPGAKLAAADNTKVAVLGVHAVADAPTVALAVDNGATPAVPSLSFGEFTNAAGAAAYLDVDPTASMFEGTTLVDVRTTAGAHVAGFQTPSLPAGAAVTLVATGSLTNGTFGLTAFPATEDLSPVIAAGIPLAASARAQIIHNAADPAGASVDVYLNGRLYSPLDNFVFRSATPFLSVPSGAEVSIDVTAPDAADNQSPLYNAKVTFEAGQKYLAIANGVVDPTQFDANANANINFGIFAIGGAKESTSETENVEAYVFHGATDVPAVGVRAKEGQVELAASISYGNTDTGYIKIPAAANTAVELFDASNERKLPLVETAAAINFSQLVGAPLVILASGFADPTKNQNGEALKLLVVPPTGQTSTIDLKPSAL